MPSPNHPDSASQVSDSGAGAGTHSGQEHAERGEIRRYLTRLMLILVVATLVMVAVGLVAYREFQGQRAESTRRVPVTRHVGPGGSVQYVPVDDAPATRE